VDDYLSQILLIGLLLILSGIFSATETALLALGEAGAHRILEEEKRHSRLLWLWKDRPNRVLTAILIANNLVNILASALATTLTHQILKNTWGDAGILGYAVAIAVGIMTFLIVMFGEIIPKTFARNNADRMVPLLPITLLAYWIFRPFATVLSRLSRRVIRASGGSDGTLGPSVTEAEVEAMIRLGTAEGVISGEKKELLSSVIEFSDTMIMEIMVPRTDVEGFSVDATLEEVLGTIAKRQFSRYPVFDGDLDTIVGILTVKDLLRYLSKEERGLFQLRDLLSHKVLIVPETKKIGELLNEFQRERVQMAVAVDEHGGTAGIVTTEDVIEEIVGEIYDEHDFAEEEIREQGDGSCLVLARTPIDRLEEFFGVALPEQDIYETVGGLVLTQAGRVLQVGEIVDFAGLHFEVRERTKTRLLSLLVTEGAPTDSEEANKDNGSESDT